MVTKMLILKEIAVQPQNFSAKLFRVSVFYSKSGCKTDKRERENGNKKGVFRGLSSPYQFLCISCVTKRLRDKKAQNETKFGHYQNNPYIRTT